MVQVVHQKETIARLWKDFSNSSGEIVVSMVGNGFGFSSGRFSEEKGEQYAISECNL